MKIILTYGTYDLMHYGHIELLRRAKMLGDKLIVGLSTDAFNENKGKSSHQPYEKRKEILAAINYVDQIFPEEAWDQKISDIKQYNADVFVMGDDWKGKFDELSACCEIVYLSRTPSISSTKVKDIISRDS